MITLVTSKPFCPFLVADPPGAHQQHQHDPLKFQPASLPYLSPPSSPEGSLILTMGPVVGSVMTLSRALLAGLP